MGNAFCFLPLPIETGLPVHVNGHFALDQNRSHLFGTYKEDVRYIWNKCLLEQVAAYSYASCIEYYRVKVQFYLHHIPHLVWPVFWTDQDIQSLGQQTMSHCRSTHL
jgi:sacsin